MVVRVQVVMVKVVLVMELVVQLNWVEADLRWEFHRPRFHLVLVGLFHSIMLSKKDLLASFKAAMSFVDGLHDSKPMAPRSYPAKTKTVVLPVLSQASLVGAEGSQLKKRAIAQAPRFLWPFLFQRQKAHVCPGIKSWYLVFLVRRSMVRRNCWLTFKSMRCFCAVGIVG